MHPSNIHIMAHASIYDIISCKTVDIIGDIYSAIHNAVCSIAVSLHFSAIHNAVCSIAVLVGLPTCHLVPSNPQLLSSLLFESLCLHSRMVSLLSLTTSIHLCSFVYINCSQHHHLLQVSCFQPELLPLITAITRGVNMSHLPSCGS